MPVFSKYGSSPSFYLAGLSRFLICWPCGAPVGNRDSVPARHFIGTIVSDGLRQSIWRCQIHVLSVYYYYHVGVSCSPGVLDAVRLLWGAARHNGLGVLSLKCYSYGTLAESSHAPASLCSMNILARTDGFYTAMVLIGLPRCLTRWSSNPSCIRGVPPTLRTLFSTLNCFPESLPHRSAPRNRLQHLTSILPLSSGVAPLIGLLPISWLPGDYRGTCIKGVHLSGRGEARRKSNELKRCCWQRQQVVAISQVIVQ